MTQLRRAKRKLDPGLPIYARRPVRTHGQTFGVRDVIPWRELGISMKTLLCWWRVRLISHNPRGDNALVRSASTNAEGERLDGPTIEDWVNAGYLPENYPPPGWAAQPSPALEQYRELDGLGPWDHEMLETRRATREAYDTPPRVRDLRVTPTVLETAVTDSPVELSEELSAPPEAVPPPAFKPGKGRRKT